MPTTWHATLEGDGQAEGLHMSGRISVGRRRWDSNPRDVQDAYQFSRSLTGLPYGVANAGFPAWGGRFRVLGLPDVSGHFGLISAVGLHRRLHVFGLL
jgi:hypothetical protein